MKQFLTLILVSMMTAAPAVWAQSNTFPSSGNAGIETTSPDELLQIGALNRNADATLSLETNDGSYASILKFQESSADYGAQLKYDANGNKFHILTGGGTQNERFTILRDTGGVGIGTSTPSARMHLYGAGSTAPVLKVQSSEGGSDGWLEAIGPYSHVSSSSAGAHYIAWGAYFNGATNSWVRTYNGLPLVAMELSTSGDFSILTEPNTSGTPSWHNRFHVKENGNVGIGTTSPSHKLTVNGTIKAEEVIVEAGIAANDITIRPKAWADDVFEADYALPSVEEVAYHIASHKRLPGVPSEDEVVTQGISVAETQATLLRKIEELTLYVIELKDENAALKERVTNLENRP